MNEGVISRMARVEVTKKLRAAYRVGSKKEKSAVLDRFCEIMGLSPSSARQYLMDETIGNPKVLRLDQRRIKPTTYSAESTHLLVRL